LRKPAAYHKLRNLFSELGFFFQERKETKRKFKELGIPFSEVLRLRNLPNICTTDTALLGKEIQLDSPFWYLTGIREIFFDRQYQFAAKTQSPVIIDCGANIGLSVVFFKKNYPGSRVIAFEPDPAIFAKLSANCSSLGLQGVQLENKAVWKENTMISFAADSSVSGRISNNGSGHTQKVPAVRLRDFLNEKVDFLKIDIEGSETEVLDDCRDRLQHVENLFVEYHSAGKDPQQLDKLLGILKDTGFRYYIKEAWETRKYPFGENKTPGYFDLQLNIFATRN
jgi:FkbM family methyltransferase